MFLETDIASLHRVVRSDLGVRPADSEKKDPIRGCNRTGVELQEDASPGHLRCLVASVSMCRIRRNHSWESRGAMPPDEGCPAAGWSFSTG